MGIFTKLFGNRQIAKIKSLISALDSSNVIIRRDAAKVLGELANPIAVDSLIVALKDEEFIVRVCAAKALGQIGGHAVINPLISAVKDYDWSVRKAAADALDKIGWKPGEDLIGVQYWIAKEDWEECIKLGEPAIVPLKEMLQDKAKDIREKATEALSRIKRSGVNSASGAKVELQDKVKGVNEKVNEPINMIDSESGIVKTNLPQEDKRTDACDNKQEIKAIELAIPPIYREKLTTLKNQFHKMAITSPTKSREELESRNTSRQLIWGEKVQLVRLHEGNADTIYYALMTCLADDFKRGAFDMGIEEVPIVSTDEVSVVNDALEKLSKSSQRVETDAGLKAYYEKDLARRLRKNRAKKAGKVNIEPALIRKITIKVHFRETFGPHDILRVGEDWYYLMPCKDYEI